MAEVKVPADTGNRPETVQPIGSKRAQQMEVVGCSLRMPPEEIQEITH
jgi:hypothetical protein